MVNILDFTHASILYLLHTLCEDDVFGDLIS